jgi:hypothetical protein
MADTPTAEPQSKNPDDSSSRLTGTNSLIDIYKAATPGETPSPKPLREIIKK